MGLPSFCFLKSLLWVADGSVELSARGVLKQTTSRNAGFDGAVLIVNRRGCSPLAMRDGARARGVSARGGARGVSVRGGARGLSVRGGARRINKTYSAESDPLDSTSREAPPPVQTASFIVTISAECERLREDSQPGSLEPQRPRHRYWVAPAGGIGPPPWWHRPASNKRQMRRAGELLTGSQRSAN